jgi:SPP1 family predicted phage head-tail adaptor
MDPGSLNQPVRLLRRESHASSSGSGIGIESWEPIAPAWCQVTPLRQTETQRGPGLDSIATHRFRLRHTDALRPTWRIEWRGAQYDIVEILPGGFQLAEWIDVMAVASAVTDPDE